MNLFILSYDTSRFSSASPVEALLENHRNVSAWSTPFKGCFFIKSDIELKDFARTLDKLFDNRGFVVSVVNGSASHTNGRAAGEIWDFIKS